MPLYDDQAIATEVPSDLTFVLPSNPECEIVGPGDSDWFMVKRVLNAQRVVMNPETGEFEQIMLMGDTTEAVVSGWICGPRTRWNLEYKTRDGRVRDLERVESNVKRLKPGDLMALFGHLNQNMDMSEIQRALQSPAEQKADTTPARKSAEGNAGTPKRARVGKAQKAAAEEQRIIDELDRIPLPTS